MAVNLNKYKSEIVAAWQDVIDDKSSTNWYGSFKLSAFVLHGFWHARKTAVTQLYQEIKTL